jgi:four helix bundle protein
MGERVDALQKKSRNLSHEVVLFVNKMPENRAYRIIGDQLFRSGTSAGANYRAVCRARSRADFISKLGIVLEEADETKYWIELLVETGLASKEQTETMYKEADEIVAMCVASMKTAKFNK